MNFRPYFNSLLRNFLPVILVNFPKYLKDNKFVQRAYFELTDFFTTVEIETTTICNRSCGYCPNSLFDREKEFMEISVFKMIIDQLAEIGYQGHIHLHRYGEPLIDDRLVTLVSLVRQSLPSAVIDIFTNGDYLTSTNFKTLVHSGVDNFIITKHWRHDDGREPTQTQGWANGFFNKLDEAELQRIEYNKMAPGNRLFNRGGKIPLRDLWHLDRCFTATQELEIDYRGNVLLCCNQFRAQDGPVFGNIMIDSIRTIWSNPQYRRIRKNLRSGHFQLEICKLCGRGIWDDRESLVVTATPTVLPRELEC